MLNLSRQGRIYYLEILMTSFGATRPECVGIVMPRAAKKDTVALMQNLKNEDVY